MRTPGRPSTVALLCLFGAAGCWRDNPAFDYDGTGSPDTGSTGAAASATDPTTAASSSSGPAPTSSSAGTDGGTSTIDPTAAGTTDPATGGSTGSPVTTVATSETTGGSDGATTTTGDMSTSGAESTGGSTTGQPMMCVGPDLGEPPRLLVKKNGAELLACGGSKSMTNAFAKFSGATLQIWDSGNCTQQGNLYEVQGVNFAISAMTFGESCSDVRIEWAPSAPCDATAFALSNGDKPAYVGAFGRRAGPSGYEAFSAEPAYDCGCAVDKVSCCERSLEGVVYAPGNYKLAFPNAGEDIDPQSSIAGHVDGTVYTFTNLRSQVHEGCEVVPPHVWFDIRWWAQIAG